MWGYVAILAALSFAQSPGRVVPDTKFDLVSAPGRFLAGATHMWDPGQAFGQLQNQAYGYLWPMGPFFLAGHSAHVPDWVVQRLWWVLLLCLAFFGVIALCRELRLGKPWTQVVAAFAFVLAPRMTSLLGETSVELWPTALAPWVLLPLVRGSRVGSVRRAAALSALAVTCCGGVNATAVSAVLPLGVVWILTRAPGPRKWPLFGWWTLFTTLGSLWWLIPLVQLGRYSPPFLDYIENSYLTSAPTGLLNSLLGTSDWVAYLAPASFPAGATLVSTSFLLLDAAALAALGLVGLAMRDHPERRFLVLGLLSGLMLVGLGYAGTLHGWFGGERQGWLDELLSPLRNTHKYDAVLRLVLSLGLVHLLARPPVADQVGRWRPALVLRGAALLAVLGLASPWLQGAVAAPGGFAAVPDYWKQAARYLDDEGRGTAVEVPAAAFGDYTWGSTHDDVLQGYARSNWAVRNVIPLAEPGNVVWLDALTERLESGRPSDELAPMLRAAGVDLVVVRNDLERLTTGAPDPAYLHSALVSSPGLELAASFGPTVGEVQGGVVDDGTRFVINGGLSQPVASVEIYRVEAATGAASLLPEAPSRIGAPGAASEDSGPWVLTPDLSPDQVGRVVLTDELRRREVAFQAVRSNASSTQPAGSLPRRPGPEQFHRFLDDQERWQSTEAWTGIAAVSASSSQAYADAEPPLERGNHPGAALDRDPRTEWSTARNTLPDSQWWQVDLLQPTALTRVSVTMGRDSIAVPSLRLSSGDQAQVVAAPAPGQRRTYRLDFSSVSALRITAVDAGRSADTSWSLAEVHLDGVAAQRWVDLPAPPATSVVQRIELRRDPEKSACPSVEGTVVCRPFLGSHGDDGDVVARRFAVTAGGDYRVAATVSLRRGARLAAALAENRGVRVLASTARPADVAVRPQAMTDGDLGTTWIAAGEDPPTIDLRWRQAQRLDSLDFRLGVHAAASAPSRVTVSAGDREVTRTVDDTGRVELPGWRTREARIVIDDVDEAVTQDGGTVTGLPAGVSELRINGATLDDSWNPQRFPCGTGPQVTIGDESFQTRVSASVSTLIRGSEVPLELCAPVDDVMLAEGGSSVLALPSPLFRVERVTLELTGGSPAAVAPVGSSLDLEVDRSGSPRGLDLPATEGDSTLVLAQNFNAGWQATLDGTPLVAQRVDGWQQGWQVPGGSAGRVEFRYAPERGYVTGLGIGGAGVLLVLALGLLVRRRTPDPRPSLRAAWAGWGDVAIAVVGAGLLTGWFGAGAVIVVTLALRRLRSVDLDSLALAAGGLVMLAAVPRVVPSVLNSVDSDATGYAVQMLCALALALVLFVPEPNGPRSFSLRKRRSKP